MDDTMRQFLLEADERSTANFDKATLTLAGGGLGVSLTFLKDIASKPPSGAWLLFTAWFCWVLSVTLVLLSQHTSHQSLRLYLQENPANRWHELTRWLNWCAPAFFIVGTVAMVIFASLNF